MKKFLGKIIPKSMIGKMSMLNLSVIVLTTVTMVIYIDLTIAVHLRAEHEQKGMAFVENLAANAPDFILAENYASLQMLVAHTLKGDDDIRYTFVVDPSGDRILAHSFVGGFPADLKSALKKNELGCKGGKPGSRMLLTEEGEVKDLYSPILGGKAGCVHVGMSMNQVNNDIRYMKLRLLGVSILLSILTIIITLAYSRKLSRAMDILTEGAGNIGNGNLAHRIIVADKSEISLLARMFNQMAESLQTYIKHSKRDRETLTRLEKLESIGDLAAGIAHDYNNLHTAVMGNLDLARLSTDKNSNAYGFLCCADKALHKAVQLTKQLLTFSLGGTPIKRVVDLKNFFTSTCPLYLSGSNCTLDFDITETLPPISIDTNQISQVMQGLLQNASEAMPAGGTITLSAQDVDIDELANPYMPPGKYIKIGISDHGKGINQDIAGRIFDPYFSTKERGTKKGQGLGLSICNSIISKHGGWINFEPNPAGGAFFYFYLKAVNEPGTFEPSPPQTASQPMSRSSIHKILVMDDEQIVREVTEQMLTNLGCQVVTAQDGLEAIKFFKEAEEAGKPFSAVIMDLVVPGSMGGVAAAQEILKIDPAAIIIAASGYSSDAVMTEYADYGFRQSLAKPYQINELQKVLATLIVL